MAVEIVSLEDGQISATSTPGDLYEADGKSALVKSMIFTNTDSAARTINVYFLKSGGTAGTHDRLLMAKDLSLPAGYSVIHDIEVSMSAGDKITAKASVTNVVDFVISGIEREVV